jgi:hypothetical protein
MYFELADEFISSDGKISTSLNIDLFPLPKWSNSVEIIIP